MWETGREQEIDRTLVAFGLGWERVVRRWGVVVVVDGT